MRMIDERSHKDVSHECFIWIAPNSIDKRFKWNWFDWFPFELNGAPKCQGRLFSGWERFNEMLKQCTSGSIEIETIVEYCVMRWSTIPHVKSFNKDTRSTRYPLPASVLDKIYSIFLHDSSYGFTWRISPTKYSARLHPNRYQRQWTHRSSALRTAQRHPASLFYN